MVFFSFKVANKILHVRKFPKNHSSIKVLEMFFFTRLISDKFQVAFEAHGSSYRHIHIYENCSANMLSVNFSIVVTSPNLRRLQRGWGRQRPSQISACLLCTLSAFLKTCCLMLFSTILDILCYTHIKWDIKNQIITVRNTIIVIKMHFDTFSASISISCIGSDNLEKHITS